MATFFQRVLSTLFLLIKHRRWLVLILLVALLIDFGWRSIYPTLDDDLDRGAIPIENGAFGEDYSTPVYLDQGWSESDSLWFYNTTQGSALLPYDFFLALEQKDSEELLRSTRNMDRYRYLPQKPTFFNPDGLPVGFVKDTYQGHSYVGFTCAACHTGQVNYKGTAIRIDGGPAMANMDLFLKELQAAMEQTLAAESKKQRFVNSVIASGNDYSSADSIIADLEEWTRTIRLYNVVNHSTVRYGYARLDAFGRIYNRVLQHMISRQNLATALKLVRRGDGSRVLSDARIEELLKDVNETIILDKQFGKIIARLESDPDLTRTDRFRIKNQIFNEPNAPVSYPFLWDISQSDYVQWNGLAENAGVGPLGRNTGEVIGVFGKLDWTSQKPNGFSLSALLTGQKNKNEHINFTSSIDLNNLERLESHLKSLTSPQWPEDILGDIDHTKADRGAVLYAKYCVSCHEIIDRTNLDRVVIAKMSAVDNIGTDPRMADNSVNYHGKSGNLTHTIQKTGVGKIVIAEDAPVVQILTSATKGVIATPDPDKTFARRWLDRLYVIGSSYFNNTIPATIKNGDYEADTTAAPYNSLLAYKGRSLNGIWATAPYLHNGSVPSLYDLLLPKKRDGDPDDGEYRPDSFMVGSREFDPRKVGFRYEGYEGTRFSTHNKSNWNTGHDYGSRDTVGPDGTELPALTQQQRWELIEFLKTL